jgi:hypothetical protein
MGEGRASEGLLLSGMPTRAICVWDIEKGGGEGRHVAPIVNSRGNPQVLLCNPYPTRA